MNDAIHSSVTGCSARALHSLTSEGVMRFVSAMAAGHVAGSDSASSGCRPWRVIPPPPVPPIAGRSGFNHSMPLAGVAVHTMVCANSCGNVIRKL
jgi:hypothetical protein